MKIFVTVGAQIPFDRLTLAVDAWAERQAGKHQFFAQVGERGVHPSHMEFAELLEPPLFKQHVLWADVLVAHAGMGSIITALQHGKPILVMPRKGALKETRNDHQLATAIRFRGLGKVAVAMDEQEIAIRLDGLASFGAADSISDHAPDDLIEAIRQFINGHDAQQTN